MISSSFNIHEHFHLLVRLANINLYNPFVQAPLAGITDPPFRSIARRFHDGLMFSEMISAEALCRGNKRTETYFHIEPCHHPIALQLEGPNAERIAEAAIKIESFGADIVDINAGCPEHKLTKDGAGGALLKDPKYLAKVARATVKAVSIPVSVKLRLGFDKDRSLELLDALADTGVAFLTFNGYTVTQRWSGQSDWDALKRLVEAGKDRGIPIIANGGAKDEVSAVEMLKYTGAIAVMIGRGTRGRPDLPGTAYTLLKDGSFKRMSTVSLRETIHDHAVLENKLYGEEKGIRRMRKNVMWYFKAAKIKGSNEQINKILNLADLDTLLDEALNTT
jgi:tRNA-dihydrouridine synthase B